MTAEQRAHRREIAGELFTNMPDAPRLSDDERDRVHQLMDAFTVEHDVRRRAHAAKLERVARRAGRDVGRGNMTRADAARGIDALRTKLDDAVPVPLFLLSWEHSGEIAADAYARGLDEGRRDDTA